MRRVTTWIGITSVPALLALAGLAGPASAIDIDGITYDTWTDYFLSPEFQAGGRRCGTVTADPSRMADSPPSDCSMSQTDPDPMYDPSQSVMEIPVVVHIILGTGGTGDIPDALVQSQIDVLNEDFQALAGTAGEDGVNTNIQFVLATLDEDGNPTTGITRTTNPTWFSDSGDYWTLSWDPKTYCNIYTNNAGGGGVLGYVPFLPATGLAGTNEDRIVVLWSAFGRPALGGPPYNLGRTLTHEMGHFLGLFHTFEGGCALGGAPGCYSTGDRICDTNSEQEPTYGCPSSRTTCSTLDPIHNYLDYTDDDCMQGFTMEQARRMRCTLQHYRATLYDEPVPVRQVSWSEIKRAYTR